MPIKVLVWRVVAVLWQAEAKHHNGGAQMLGHRQHCADRAALADQRGSGPEDGLDCLGGGLKVRAGRVLDERLDGPLEGYFGIWMARGNERFDKGEDLARVLV